MTFAPKHKETELVWLQYNPQKIAKNHLFQRKLLQFTPRTPIWRVLTFFFFDQLSPTLAFSLSIQTYHARLLHFRE